jgi:riboflavin synthase
VHGQAHVERVDRNADFSSVRIRFPPGKLDGVQVGASVAVNGTCLTVRLPRARPRALSWLAPDMCAVNWPARAQVTAQEDDVAAFDIISETLRATNLGGLERGSAVNFERSARMGDEIGGHNVSGHIHTTASVSRVEESPNNRRITFQARPPAWRAPLAHDAMCPPRCSPSLRFEQC